MARPENVNEQKDQIILKCILSAVPGHKVCKDKKVGTWSQGVYRSCYCNIVNFWLYMWLQEIFGGLRCLGQDQVLSQAWISLLISLLI